MPLLGHPVILALGWHGQSVELSGKSDREVADVDHFLNFTFTFGSNLSHFQGD